MSDWPSTRSQRVLAALMRSGRTVKRQTGSHTVLSRPGRPNLVFAFHDREKIGPRMLARIAKHSGLKPADTPAASAHARCARRMEEARDGLLRRLCVQQRPKGGRR